MKFTEAQLLEAYNRTYDEREGYHVAALYKWISEQLKTKDRSSNQNRYYWECIVGVLADEVGYTPQEMHEILKGKFLSTERYFDGEWYKVPRSTTDLSTVEFETYLKRIREWASVEMNILLQLPNEQ